MGTDLRREKELAGQISGERTFQVKKKNCSSKDLRARAFLAGWRNFKKLQEITRQVYLELGEQGE